MGVEKHSFVDIRGEGLGHPTAAGLAASRSYVENYVGKPSTFRYFDAVLFGNARVSTADQNPSHQIDALRRAGVADDDIYVDHASGAKASRPQLDIVLRLLRKRRHA